MKPLHGAITALITPFRNGRINKSAYEADVERQIKSGIDGLVACGTTAETPTLNAGEREWLIEAAVRVAGGRVPVIAGTGTNSTTSTIDETRAAERLGADAALVVTPYYNRPSQEGLFRHFEAVARSAGLPVILYNVPARTGVDLSTQTVARLADVANIVGIKDATGKPERLGALRVLTRPDFLLFSGDDATTLAAIRSGADGAISVIANAFPAEWGAMCRAAAMKQEAAEALAARFAPLLRALSLEANPGPIKYLMALTCRSHSAEVRLPLVPVTRETAASIRVEFDIALRGAKREIFAAKGSASLPFSPKRAA